MAHRFQNQQEDQARRGYLRVLGGRKAGFRRPRLVRVVLLLAGLATVLAAPVFWLYDDKSFQYALLALVVQYSVILIIIVAGWRRTTRHRQKALSPGWTETIDGEDTRIWHTYSSAETEANASNVALIADLSSHTKELANNLARQGYVVSHSNDSDAMLSTIEFSSAVWDFLIFDLDLSDDLQACIDDLVIFRKTCTVIPILLISETVSRDEFSDYRRAIGDATLRKPVSEDRLLAAIAALRT
jgi:CheY-like chemotaxis protein